MHKAHRRMAVTGGMKAGLVGEEVEEEVTVMMVVLDCRTSERVIITEWIIKVMAWKIPRMNKSVGEGIPVVSASMSDGVEG